MLKIVYFEILADGQLGYASNPSKSMNTALLQYDPDGRLLEKTLATVDRLWSITEDLNILYRENWTHLAQLEMRHYQDQIVRTLRKAMLEEKYSFRQTWTFPMSLLYALTLVTTIGKKRNIYKIICQILNQCISVPSKIMGNNYNEYYSTTLSILWANISSNSRDL